MPDQSNVLTLSGTAAPTLPNQPIAWLADTEPWPEPVDGQQLLDAQLRLLNRFVVLPKWAGETLVLWNLHTYAFQLRDISTYMGIESPEKRCGKTTLLTVLSELVNRPVVAANISSPAFFRVIEETRPTLLIDEADTLLTGNDELRGILNAGYSRKTAFVVRVVHQTANENENTINTMEAGPEPVLGPAGARGSSLLSGRLARFSCWCEGAGGDWAAAGHVGRPLYRHPDAAEDGARRM